MVEKAKRREPPGKTLKIGRSLHIIHFASRITAPLRVITLPLEDCGVREPLNRKYILEIDNKQWLLFNYFLCNEYYIIMKFLSICSITLIKIVMTK